MDYLSLKEKEELLHCKIKIKDLNHPLYDKILYCWGMLYDWDLHAADSNNPANYYLIRDTRFSDIEILEHDAYYRFIEEYKSKYRR